MDFTLTEEQQMLSETLRRFLAERYPIEHRNRIAFSKEGYSREILDALVELGVPMALTDASFGGTGYDIMVVFEQLGRALVVEPFLGLLMAHRLSPDDTADGTTAVALYEPAGRYDLGAVITRATKTEHGYTVRGAKAVVPQLEMAKTILVSARTDEGIGLFAVPRDAPGVKVRGYELIDGGRGGELVLEGAPAELRIADASAAIEVSVAAGIVALSAEAVGIMDVMQASTLEYLRTRVQFGIPIGKFQALQHRMANVAIEIEQARSSAINAATALNTDRTGRERAASAAKYTIGRVGTIVVEEHIQLHGGIGMTWELALPHFAKRLTMIGHQLGDEDHHLERYSKL